MLTIEDLIKTDKVTTPTRKLVKGKWCEIRVTPDLIAGELLNIGVCFIDSKKLVHYKLMESANPFGCLYGKGSLEQFQHLLKATDFLLKENGVKANFGSHIKFGHFREYVGENVELILEELYTAVVTLGRSKNIESIDANNRIHRSINTADLRKNLLRRFKERHKDQYLQFWKDEPITVQQGGIYHAIDMPIWSADDLLRPRCFGTVISVDYSDPVYRKSFLNTAYKDLTIARDYLSKDAQGGIFILRPSLDSNSESLINEIDNEIDATTWALINKYKIKAEVTETTALIEQSALAFVN